jgi:hypothetical protein
MMTGHKLKGITKIKAHGRYITVLGLERCGRYRCDSAMSNSRECAHPRNPPLQHHTGKVGSKSNMTHCVYAVLLDAVSMDVKSSGEK